MDYYHQPQTGFTLALVGAHAYLLDNVVTSGEYGCLGSRVASRANINMFLDGGINALPYPVPTFERLLSLALWGGGAYLIWTLVIAALLALLTPRTVARFPARYLRVLSAWTLSQVGPQTINAISHIALSAGISSTKFTAILSPTSPAYNALVGDALKLLFAVLAFVIASYLLVVTIPAGHVISGRHAALVFGLQFVASVLLGLLIAWGVSLSGLHPPL